MKGISVSENEKNRLGQNSFYAKGYARLHRAPTAALRPRRTRQNAPDTFAHCKHRRLDSGDRGHNFQRRPFGGGTSSDSADSSTGTNYSGYTGLSAKPAENNGVALLAAGAAEISDLSGLRIAAPKTGEAMQSSISETAEYAGSISWNPAGTTFQPGIAYRAQISLTAKTGYVFPASIQPTLPGATISGVSVSQESEGNTLCFYRYVYRHRATESAFRFSRGFGSGDSLPFPAFRRL